MAPKHTKQSKKKPALKDLSAFENSRQLTSIMRDALVALSARSEHEAPGFSASPDLIKIDPRNGQGLLMDYDVSLNMKAELTMPQSYCGRPVEEVTYYMSLETSPVGCLRLSHKQWMDMFVKKKHPENLETFPVPQEVWDWAFGLLFSLDTTLWLNEGTDTPIRDFVNVSFESKEEGTKKTEEKRGSSSRWEVLPLEYIQGFDQIALD